MKKIICLLVLLALAPGAHADKKKKRSDAGNNAPVKAPGGGGGGGGKRAGGGGGGFSGMPRMGQPANRSGAPRVKSPAAPSVNRKAPSARQGKSPLSPSAGQAGAGKRASNPLLRKGGAAGPKNAAANPLARTNRNAAGKKGNPLAKQNAGQAGLKGPNAGKLNRNNPNAQRNRGPVAQGARGLRNSTGLRAGRTARANFRVRPYREVFRSYRPIRHDRYWYDSRYSQVVFVGGGYYYWDAGYWYPAWGYDPAFSFYVYDGPIYTYDNLPPDQVTMNVQIALQDEGYYTGEIDGQVGPKTRDALGAYQSDHNLEVTSAVDEPTVEALGLTQNT